MQQRRSFLLITIADLIARSAYQMGKTPLLPVFAASLGAGDVLLGMIVAVSTLTGMVLKPFVGIFSDRWGRRRWLLIGTAFFAGMPFLYRFVHTPEQLFAIRMVHGLATAIYGPVTLAYVAELSSPRQRAGRFGFFSLARSAGYIIGPALAGWLLLTLDPVQVFTIIGLLSTIAFIPVLLLPEPESIRSIRRQPLAHQIERALRIGSNTPAIWISGTLDGAVYIASYALKAFLPVYGAALGMSIAQIGLFFSLQEGTSMLLKPAGGRVGDRWGPITAVSIGMILFGGTLPLLMQAPSVSAVFGLAALYGAAQALIFPSTTALVANKVDPAHLGAGMGLTGALDNLGKAIGPVLGGLLIARFDFAFTLLLLGAMLIAGALLVRIAAPTDRWTGVLVDDRG